MKRYEVMQAYFTQKPIKAFKWNASTSVINERSQQEKAFYLLSSPVIYPSRLRVIFI